MTLPLYLNKSQSKKAQQRYEIEAIALRLDDATVDEHHTVINQAVKDLTRIAASMRNVTTKRATQAVSARMTPDLRRQIIQAVQTSTPDTPYAQIAKQFNVAGGRVTEIMRSIGH